MGSASPIAYVPAIVGSIAAYDASGDVLVLPCAHNPHTQSSFSVKTGVFKGSEKCKSLLGNTYRCCVDVASRAATWER